MSNQDENTQTQQNTDWTPEEVPQLTVDVYKSGDTIFVVSTVAGVNPQDLDVSVDNNTLMIKGVRKKPYSSKESTILLEECFWGEFYRELTINESLDVDNIRATLNQGVLTIKIPILKTSSQKKIEVKLGL